MEEMNIVNKSNQDGLEGEVKGSRKEQLIFFNIF